MNLNQITISVSDVEKSIIFYQNLGLNLIVKSLPHYARFECMQGDATVSLHQQKTTGNSGIWIYFEVLNVDEKVQELLKLGYEFDEMPNDKSWLWRESRLEDPDKNRLIIYSAGKNRKNPPWRI